MQRQLSFYLASFLISMLYISNALAVNIVGQIDGIDEQNIYIVFINRSNSSFLPYVSVKVRTDSSGAFGRISSTLNTCSKIKRKQYFYIDEDYKAAKAICRNAKQFFIGLDHDGDWLKSKLLDVSDFDNTKNVYKIHVNK